MNRHLLNALLAAVICFAAGCSSTMSSKKPFVRVLNDDGNYQQLLAGSPETAGMHSGRVYLKPGETCGEHSTDDHEEMLIFLSGTGQAIVGDGKTMEVGSGKILYIPPFTPHNIRNNSDKPMNYIYCVAPVH